MARVGPLAGDVFRLEYTPKLRPRQVAFDAVHPVIQFVLEVGPSPLGFGGIVRFGRAGLSVAGVRVVPLELEVLPTLKLLNPDVDATYNVPSHDVPSVPGCFVVRSHSGHPPLD